MVQRDRHDRLAAEQVDDRHLLLDTRQREIGETIVVLPRRGVLQDDAVGSSARQDFEASGVGRVGEASLALDHDDVRLLLAERAQHLVLDLPGDEVIHQAVHDQTVAHALHPGGLAGSDQDGADPVRAETLR